MGNQDMTAAAEKIVDAINAAYEARGKAYHMEFKERASIASDIKGASAIKVASGSDFVSGIEMIIEIVRGRERELGLVRSMIDATVEHGKPVIQIVLI